MNHTGLEFRSSILQNSLSCFSPKIHLQDLWKRFQFVLDHNLGHFEANLFDRAEIVREASKYRAFQGRLNSRSEPRTKLVAKTPNPQVLARVSLCWPPMSVCGKNVYALRACKRSNRDFLRLYTGNTYTFSLIQSSSITRGVLRCLLGFLALWGQKPCGGNNIILRSLLAKYSFRSVKRHWLNIHFGTCTNIGKTNELQLHAFKKKSYEQYYFDP